MATAARTLERALRRALRGSGPGPVRRAAGDPAVLAETMRVVPDWRQVTDGRAARLGPDETISLRGSGLFAERDPLVVAPGWRSAGRTLGLLAWFAALGVWWWRRDRDA